MKKFLFYFIAVMSAGCSPGASKLPTNYAECLERVILETKHQAALVFGVTHCEKLDPRGAKAYNAVTK
jgi:hypothetical protein